MAGMWMAAEPEGGRKGVAGLGMHSIECWVSLNLAPPFSMWPKTAQSTHFKTGWVAVSE